jgi:phosphatidylserine decarboxylase
VIRFAQEGLPYIKSSLFISILSLAALALVLGFKGNSTFVYLFGGITFIAILFTMFFLFFFRDPERNIPEGDNIFVSPADGKVILIKKIYDNKYLNENIIEISIFMSPLDVHVNRSPCDGVIELVEYNSGRYLAAYREDASFSNENIVMLIRGPNYRILVRQVAGFIARRAVCRLKVGDFVKRGERYGIIKFGSRLDVYLPEDTIVKVRNGDKVKAGETILGGLL